MLANEVGVRGELQKIDVYQPLSDQRTTSRGLDGGEAHPCWAACHPLAPPTLDKTNGRKPFQPAPALWQYFVTLVKATLPRPFLTGDPLACAQLSLCHC